MSGNLTERLKVGRLVARAQHKADDAAKLGNLRAGNSGIMASTGDVAGSCHRRAHLRQLGLEVEEPTDSNLIMFQMGTTNEDVVYNDLIHTGAKDEIILREEEIPITWFTSNGTKVTGRPDMVVCKFDPRIDNRTMAEVILNGVYILISQLLTPIMGGAFEGPWKNFIREAQRLIDIPSAQPEWGIEIKSVASVWTTREVLGEGRPKLEHLIQASHYAWKLGIPFKLLYKQYANQALPSWAQKMFPKQSEANSEHVEYNEKGDIKNIKPFEIVYELEYTKGGYLQYRREDTDGVWIRTMVTIADIERYYEFISRMPESGDIGPIPLTIGADGKEKNYSNCDFCPLKVVCLAKGATSDYNKWLSEVRKQLASGG